MKLKKFIVNYWGDIIFLLIHPLAISINNRYFRMRPMRIPLTLHLAIAYAILTTVALIWLVVFLKKRKRTLRDLQYPLYFPMAGLCMSLYHLGFRSIYVYTLFTSIERLFVVLIAVRLGLWLKKWHEAKKTQASPENEPN